MSVLWSNRYTITTRTDHFSYTVEETGGPGYKMPMFRGPDVWKTLSKHLRISVWGRSQKGILEHGLRLRV